MQFSSRFTILINDVRTLIINFMQKLFKGRTVSKLPLPRPHLENV